MPLLHVEEEVMLAVGEAVALGQGVGETEPAVVQRSEEDEKIATF